MTTATVQKLIDKIDVPDGFDLTDGIGWREGLEDHSVSTRYGRRKMRGAYWLMLASNDRAMIFNISTSNREFSVTGSTMYRRNDTWYTFDRRGIESSFYMDSIGEDPNGIIVMEMKRISDRMAKPAALVIPGLRNMMVSVKRHDEIRRELKAHRCPIITPAGMGVAYRLHTRPSRRRAWDVPADPRTAAFFGVDRLWLERLDWD